MRVINKMDEYDYIVLNILKSINCHYFEKDTDTEKKVKELIQYLEEKTKDDIKERDIDFIDYYEVVTYSDN